MTTEHETNRHKVARGREAGGDTTTDGGGSFSKDVAGADDNERPPKAKRHDIELPVADVDIKLADKLDNLLRIRNTRKPKFSLNKPKGNSPNSDRGLDQIKLQSKNLTREDLRERLLKKYDTLVPELDPKRPQVKLVKILSAKESIELGKEQAKKQLQHQLELSSISGNRLAHANGIPSSFKIYDGYEMPPRCFVAGKKSLLRRPKAKSTHAQVTIEPSTSIDSDHTETNDEEDNTKPKLPAKSSKSVKFSDQNETITVSPDDDEFKDNHDSEYYDTTADDESN